MGLRRKVVPPPGATTLVVLAGFPKGVTPALVQRVRSFKPRFEAVSVPFSEDDNRVYGPGSPAIRQLLLAACGSTLTQQAKPPNGPVPPPNRLLLLYARVPGFEELLRSFEFAPFPIPVTPPKESSSWHPWRKDTEYVWTQIREALAFANEPSGAAMMVRLRVERLDPADPLLLPPQNFHTPNKRPLRELFAEVQRGGRAWNGLAVGSMPVAKYDFRSLPNFFRRTGGKEKRFATDRRGLVFASANKAQHGAVRAVPPVDAAEASRLLRSLFRFGTPVPQGFQHDVQWPGTRLLQHEPFQCAERGEVPVSGSHANVYLNDVVRP